MKNILLYILLFGISTTAFSQGNQKFKDQDPKAKVVLDKLEKKHKKIDNIVINFSAKIYGAKITTQKLSGKAYKTNKKYSYVTKDYVVISDGKSNWTYVKKDNEVTISSEDDAEEENALMNPSKLLTIWQKGFKYKFIGEKMIGGKKIQIIKLFPKNTKKSKFHTIVLHINKAKNELVKIMIKGRDGVNMDFTIKKFKSGEKIPVKTYKFDKSKYPNCTENDMRF